jgi:hypothetical protein
LREPLREPLWEPSGAVSLLEPLSLHISGERTSQPLHPTRRDVRVSVEPIAIRCAAADVALLQAIAAQWSSAARQTVATAFASAAASPSSSRREADLLAAAAVEKGNPAAPSAVPSGTVDPACLPSEPTLAADALIGGALVDDATALVEDAAALEDDGRALDGGHAGHGATGGSIGDRGSGGLYQSGGGSGGGIRGGGGGGFESLFGVGDAEAEAVGGNVGGDYVVAFFRAALGLTLRNPKESNLAVVEAVSLATRAGRWMLLEREQVDPVF